MNKLLCKAYSYSNEDFNETSKALMVKFASIDKVFDKIRTSINSSWYKIKAIIWNSLEFKDTIALDITHIADGIAMGDTFSAGIIQGLLNLMTIKQWSLGTRLTPQNIIILEMLITQMKKTYYLF
ncbi:MAG: 2-dehydro-3-deoxygluconokinase [Maribacter sp.]|jgi:2-dehydro-3-deoxygluconokinase